MLRLDLVELLLHCCWLTFAHHLTEGGLLGHVISANSLWLPWLKGFSTVFGKRVMVADS
jgi:hypothetical protein